MSRDLRAFGSAAWPLRASALPYLVKCPWRATMFYLDMLQDQSGKAAQTGSLVHVGVESLHRGKGVDEAAKAMAARLTDFPDGDIFEAERHLRDYAADPRNQEAEITHAELPVVLNLSPADDDPTKQAIVVRGTIDQVRRVGSKLKVFDVKTGQPGGWDMLNDYAFQLAAYALAATEKLGEDVEPGAVIRTRGYQRRGVKASDGPDGVFFWVPYGLAECRLLLDAVRVVVSKIRSGEPWVGPGPHCAWCPAGGLENCLPDFRRLSE
jgi:PD-(D/E)XK nuclease superfamily protein